MPKLKAPAMIINSADSSASARLHATADPGVFTIGPDGDEHGIYVQVLDVKPHPDQAEHNPGCWAVKLHVTHKDKSRTFWRWYNVRRLNENGAYINPGTTPPMHHEVLAQFWEDTFGELHGFDFESANS